MRHFLVISFLAWGIAATARAQAPNPAAVDQWSLEATVGAVSQYRDRGVPLSDGKVAAQAGATLSHASGLYGDVYASSIAP